MIQAIVRSLFLFIFFAMQTAAAASIRNQCKALLNPHGDLISTDAQSNTDNLRSLRQMAQSLFFSPRPDFRSVADFIDFLAEHLEKIRTEMPTRTPAAEKGREELRQILSELSLAVRSYYDQPFVFRAKLIHDMILADGHQPTEAALFTGPLLQRYGDLREGWQLGLLFAHQLQNRYRLEPLAATRLAAAVLQADLKEADLQLAAQVYTRLRSTSWQQDREIIPLVMEIINPPVQVEEKLDAAIWTLREIRSRYSVGSESAFTIAFMQLSGDPQKMNVRRAFRRLDTVSKPSSPAYSSIPPIAARILARTIGDHQNVSSTLWAQSIYRAVRTWIGADKGSNEERAMLAAIIAEPLILTEMEMDAIRNLHPLYEEIKGLSGYACDGEAARVFAAIVSRQHGVSVRTHY